MAKGGVRHGAGRPTGTTKDIKKNLSLQIRVTQEQKDKITQLAEKQGKTISGLILDCLGV